ncbi:replication-associated protein [Crucivirus-93]|nr:replication-associated protein [Crucivirus-93]
MEPKDSKKNRNAGTSGTASVILKGKARCYTGTWNNYSEEEYVKLGQFCIDEKCVEYAYQKEEGEIDGTPHIQFAMKFENPRSWAAIVKKLTKNVQDEDKTKYDVEGKPKNNFHLEKAKNWIACMKYCSKDDTCVGGKVKVEKVKDPYILDDPLEGNDLHPWQKELELELEVKADKRSIIWYYDHEGNSGKTTFAKYLCIKYPGEVIYMAGKAADLKYGVFDYHQTQDAMVLKGFKRQYLRIVMFDLTRSTEDFISWQGIEEVKNGIFYNTKYKSGMCLYNCPHVIIFANFKPNKLKLSLDRWNIRILGKINGEIRILTKLEAKKEKYKREGKYESDDEDEKPKPSNLLVEDENIEKSDLDLFEYDSLKL